MKQLFLALILFTSFHLFGQYTYSPNTLYMIPPTSGCNGQWAVLDTAFTSGFCTGPIYNIFPVGCAVIDSRVGDTLYFDLCAIPCNVIEVSTSGNSCMNCNVDIATSVSSSSLLPTISIHPNPTSGQITISLEEAKTGVLSIRNYLGQIVMKQGFNNTQELNMSLDGPTGIYFLQVESDGQVITKKVVKQ
jgi:hypothetical protein